MKFNQRLAVTGAGVALGFTAISANSTQAATVTVDFTINGTSDALLNQQFSGFYSYDDTTTPASLATGFPPKYGLTGFSLNILGESYSISDLTQGAGYGGSATGLLTNGFKLAPADTLVAPGYGGNIASGLAVKSEFSFFEDQFSYSTVELGQSSGGRGRVVYQERTSSTPIPEPSPLAGLSVVGIFLYYLK